MEFNQIQNTRLKGQIGDYAIALLLDQKLLKPRHLKKVIINIGYIFTTDEDEVEALFYISYKKKVFYFAVQKGKLMLLDIDENIYDLTVSNMIELHECLQSNALTETDAQKSRRLRNCEYIKEQDIISNENLLCTRDELQVKLKSLEDICKRAIACLIVVQIACDINKGNYSKSLEFFKPMLKKYGVENVLNSKERRIVEGTYSEQDAIDMDWAYESYWSLCWCLGLVDDIHDATEICDGREAILLLIKEKSFDDFKNKCIIRSVSEILDMQDLYMRYHWAINESKVNNEASIGDLNKSVVIERRRALEWIISDESDWYDLQLDA